MKINKYAFFPKCLIFLSVYSPVVYSPINIFQIILWAVVPLLVFHQFVIRRAITKRGSFLFLHLFILSIFVAFSIPLLDTSVDSPNILPAIGGMEAYLQLYGAYLVAAFTAKRISIENVEEFIVFIIAPITSISILFFIIDPNLATNSIYQYSLGVQNSGQWRFSSFYGLPYYAAIAYIFFISITVGVLLKKSHKPFTRLLLIINILVLIFGGFLTASKTFFAGFLILIFYVLALSGIRTSNKVAIISSIFIVVTTIYVLLVQDYAASISELGAVVGLVIQNLSSPIESLLFRYSSENSAVNELFLSIDWNLIAGVGARAASIATDSQARDVLYRFGLLGAVPFALFLLSIFYNLKGLYRLIFIAIAIGALGSNTFTPINFTFLIWYCFFLNILQTRRRVLKPSSSRFRDDIFNNQYQNRFYLAK